ncbi:MAG TPA: Flp family type IVb pilin [Anaerolineales bacterium]|nr:Flp family type IVb pilin [Anaerolineales bacterium]
MKKVSFRQLLTEEAGNDLVEYGLILVLIAIAAYTAVETLGINISDFFNYVSGLF